MKLDRMNEMEIYLADTLKKMAQKRVDFLIKEYREQNKLLCDLISDILKGLVNSRKGYLIISYLRSSIVTRSNDFLFIFYSGEPYVEEEPDQVFWQVEDILRGTEKDMIEIEMILRKKFIRIISCEMESIRREYMIELYAECKKLFQLILSDIKEKEGIKVYYGEYMGEVPIEIGII